VSTNKPPFATIRQMLLAGRAIPFLGSGASLPSDHDEVAPLELASLRPPSAGQLTRYLACVGDIAPDDATDLPRTAQHYDTLLGVGSLREQLHQVFNQPFAPGRLHRFLASIPALPLIVTTNYDDLIERAFRDASRPYHLVTYNNDTEMVRIWWHGAADPEEQLPKHCDIAVGRGATTVIYKLHGTVDQSAVYRDNYVITEEDYVEFLSSLSVNQVIPVSLAEVFKTSHFLFLGYSLRDWNIRVILHEIWKEWRWQFQSWAIQKSASDLDRTYWERKRLSIFTMAINEFLDGLDGSIVQAVPGSEASDAGH